MWIFLNNSFLSIVQDKTKPGTLVVRARIKGDIERVFPGANVKHTPDADYGFRTLVAREALAKGLVQKIQEIDYPNFKDSVKEGDRHDAYMSVWTAMRALQERRARRGRRP